MDHELAHISTQRLVKELEIRHTATIVLLQRPVKGCEHEYEYSQTLTGGSIIHKGMIESVRQELSRQDDYECSQDQEAS